MLSCLRDPGWIIRAPYVPGCLQTDILLEYPSILITCGLPLDRASAQRFATSLRYSGHTITPFLWHSSQDHLGSCNEFPCPSRDWPLPLCCLSGRRQSPPSSIPQTFDRPSTLLPVLGYYCGCFCPSLQTTCLLKTGCSCGHHNPPQRSLLSLPPLLWFCLLTFVVVWRCVFSAGPEKPLSLNFSPLNR